MELAQINFDTLKQAIGVKPELSSFGSIISELLLYLFPLAGLLLLLYLLFGGLQMMTSAGDPKKMEGAKQKLTNALIGFIIVFASYWIVQIVGKVLGIEIISEIF